jgi:3-oxoadipate enol-lactonase
MKAQQLPVKSELSYSLSGPLGAPFVVLAGSLGATGDMWAAQLPVLAKDFRVLQFSYPGHGQSGINPEAASMAGLAKGVMDLIDQLGAERFSLVGLSLGGMLGLHMAATAPDRIQRLVASCCRYYQTPDLAKQWDERIASVQARGMDAVVQPTLERWLGESFRRKHPEQTLQVRSMMASTTLAGYAHCAAAVRDFDGRDLVSRISAKTLIISGDNDLAAPGEHMRELAQVLPCGRYERLAGAHLANIECAEDFNQLIGAFLSEG